MATSGTTALPPVYGVIYRVTNTVNGHCYIGQTKTKLSLRWSKHKGDARNGAGWVLSAALRKYGVPVFVLDVLQECDSKNTLNTAEVAWIARLAPEYNSTAGGGGLGSPSQAVRDKISKTTKGRPKSAEARRNIAAGLVGRVPSEGMREKLRAAFKGRDLRGPRSAEERAQLADRNRARRKHPVDNTLRDLYAAAGCHTKAERISLAHTRMYALHPEKREAVAVRLRTYTMTDAKRQKISVAVSGERNPFFGQTHTDDTRAKMRAAHAARPPAVCPVCGKNGQLSNMKRWHFDNCRSVA